ncbi:tRNA 2'-phosphotransferase 1-like isoform X4 [Acanthaster planci]|uniref:2'-phosphotransferase n=1 Tax=Acanthaster planci TaxID=133434 RepID=A0A8B7XT62_ACAPL|nr:tRNA 2'-phosphotransferase 1-like isoform X4 [Acanthaster planci]
MSRSERSRDVHLSKKLTFVLRHKAVELGFDIDSGGFINVDDLLAHPMFSHFTVGDIKRVVTSNDKQRFSLKEHPDSKKLQICANQGHSFQGLSRMKRTHVHFAQGEPGENGVISGMRRSCDLMIFLNLEKALQGGLSFFLSKNGVILCPGDENGLIHPRYFKQVMQTHPRELLSCT